MILAVPIPVLLLHGFSQTAAAWSEVGAGLDRERYMPSAIELPGHGAAADQPTTLQRCLELCEQATGAEPAIVCGYSLGGRIGLAYALSRPLQVRGLVLVSSSPGIAPEVDRQARCKADDQLASRLEADGVEVFSQQWGRQALFDGQRPEVREIAHQMRLMQSASRLANALRDFSPGRLPANWDRLSELELPVEIVVGELDQKYVELGQRMLSQLPDADLIRVPGVSHAVPLEAPTAVAQAIEIVALR